MAVEVLSLLGTCLELLIRKGTSDWREIKGTHLCYLLSEGAGGVGSRKSPAKQVCSQVLPPFSVTPHLVFELPF